MVCGGEEGSAERPDYFVLVLEWMSVSFSEKTIASESYTGGSRRPDHSMNNLIINRKPKVAGSVIKNSDGSAT